MKEPKIKRDAGYLYFLLGRMLGLAKMTTNNNLKEELLVLEKEIEDFLNHVEKHTLFVQGTTPKVEILKKATIKIGSNSPHIFVISGVKSAGDILKECVNDLKYIFQEYEMERITGEKEILFFIRKIPNL